MGMGWWMGGGEGSKGGGKGLERNPSPGPPLGRAAAPSAMDDDFDDLQSQYTMPAELPDVNQYGPRGPSPPFWEANHSPRTRPQSRANLMNVVYTWPRARLFPFLPDRRWVLFSLRSFGRVAHEHRTCVTHVHTEIDGA